MSPEVLNTVFCNTRGQLRFASFFTREKGKYEVTLTRNLDEHRLNTRGEQVTVHWLCLDHMF